MGARAHGVMCVGLWVSEAWACPLKVRYLKALRKEAGWRPGVSGLGGGGMTVGLLGQSSLSGSGWGWARCTNGSLALPSTLCVQPR